MPGWFLHALEIEGFRGVNNEGAPLVLKFKDDRVNSISAPNGVGKSSIFDAVTFALTGKIPKLENLPTAEAGHSYYLNRFHQGGLGTVKMTMMPDDGSAAVVVTVTRDAAGNRTVAATGAADGNALLAELNREFVLLDASTFNSFIEEPPLSRGRSFAGLLGLSRYSSLRQGLQGVSNTRAFNGYFDVNRLNGIKKEAGQRIRLLTTAIQKAHEDLVDERIADGVSRADAQAIACGALQGIELLKPHTQGKALHDISVDGCVSAIKDAEGGEDRDRLETIIRQISEWDTAESVIPSPESFARLTALAEARDTALASTKGAVFKKLYETCEEILTDGSWAEPNTCPVCENAGGVPLLPEIQSHLAHYEEVHAVTLALEAEWQQGGWPNLATLENKAKDAAEVARIPAFARLVDSTGLSAEQLLGLSAWIVTLQKRAADKKAALQSEKEALEKKLPPSLVTLTTKVEAARRLQSGWRDLETEESREREASVKLDRVDRIKKFLDAASGIFSAAEGAASARRLAAVEPRCREYFGHIMVEPIIPALSKRGTGEELAISLAEFWSLQNVSAPALLSESYRNAFAISVYLAAASLYSGTPRFLILDDVTSSFDAGHQFQLVELIRTKFGRPANAGGPQAIIFSHDTMLEKLFNTHSSNGDWFHQRIEGTARTELLPQSGAVNKVRDATITMLNAGRVQDAAPRIRQYLEYKLEEIIIRCKIPVPFDVAHTDGKAMPSTLIKAVNDAVALHDAAGTLVLDAAQVAGLNTSVATITGNYLAHWNTGQTQAFSGGSLLAVMHAIDAYADCFRFEDPAGSGQRQYYKSLSQKL